MAQIIRVTAAVDRILADVSTTRTRAASLQVPWAPLAEEYLADVATLGQRATADHTAAASAFTAARAVVDRLIASNHAKIAAVHDELWNALGRPRNDLRFGLLLPEGVGTGSTGPEADQPAALGLLADALEQHLHPRLAPARCDALAAEVRALVAPLEVALAALGTARANQSRFVAQRSWIGRIAQNQLVQLKRTLIGQGWRETEIHEVIPDRTPEKKADAPAAPTPTSSTTGS